MQFVFFLRTITRRLYRYRGLSRLADWVRKAYMHSGRLITVRDFDGNLSFHCDLGEHIGSQVFWKGAYSGDQLALLGTLLQPDWVFLDIGANQGEFSLFAAKRLQTGAVMAFEPAPLPAGALEANLAANGFRNVQVIRKALGRIAGQARLFAADNKFEGEINQGLYTFYPRPGIRHPEAWVDIIRLDDFVKEKGLVRIDVLKIDIEGAELDMLEGARESIARFRPIILLEINAITAKAAGYEPVRICEWLSGMQYRFESIGRGGRTRPLPAHELKTFQNIYCLPCER